MGLAAIEGLDWNSRGDGERTTCEVLVRVNSAG